MNFPSVETVFVVHAASCLFLVGVIWVIQVVHYPLFASVGEASFVQYHHEHMRRISAIVVPVMLVELATAAILLAQQPEALDSTKLWIASALLASVWLITFLVQVPQHSQLQRGFDARIVRQLVRGNRWRTGAWSVRGIWVIWQLSEWLG